MAYVPILGSRASVSEEEPCEGSSRVSGGPISSTDSAFLCVKEQMITFAEMQGQDTCQVIMHLGVSKLAQCLTCSFTSEPSCSTCNVATIGSGCQALRAPKWHSTAQRPIEYWITYTVMPSPEPYCTLDNGLLPNKTLFGSVVA